MRNNAIWLSLGLLAMTGSVSLAQGEKLPPPAPVAPAPTQVAAAPAPEAHKWSVSCCDKQGCMAKLHKLCEWASYRPLSQPGICACCPRPTCTCQPPLWTYFYSPNCGKGRCITGACVSGHCPPQCDKGDCGGKGSCARSTSCCFNAAPAPVAAPKCAARDCSGGACAKGSCGVVEAPKQHAWTDWLNIGERFGKCWTRSTPSEGDQGVIVISGESK